MRLTAKVSEGMNRKVLLGTRFCNCHEPIPTLYPQRFHPQSLKIQNFRVWNSYGMQAGWPLLFCITLYDRLS